MTSELSQVMELWLEESCKREVERRENERREQEWKEAETHREEEWRRKEEEWRRMEEQRTQRSEDLMRTLVATLAEREPRRPRTEFGIDSPEVD